MTIALDANGLPVGHEDAVRAAARDLSDWLNELPESVYHLTPTDAECAASIMAMRYVQTLRGGK